MSDFFFSPAVAEVRPGERITFALRNFGLYEHEFMAGREAVPGKGYAADWLAREARSRSVTRWVTRASASASPEWDGDGHGRRAGGCRRVRVRLLIRGALRERHEGEARRGVESRSCYAGDRRALEERGTHAERDAPSMGSMGA